MEDNKILETCCITHVIKRLVRTLGHSIVMRKELPTIIVLSLFACFIFFLLKPIVNIISFKIIIQPYVTLIGFSLSTFAIFVSEVKDLEILASKLDNAEKALNDFVSLSIMGLVIPLVGIIPNLITIPGFTIYGFDNNQYWNVFFCSMSILWIVNSIFHVISIKITKINRQ